MVVFEGRDGAGKGGVIKAITERVSPRVYRVVALPAPTEREKSQMYVQRYMRHMPAAGEIVIFDRSWYNRAGVERVMEFCSMEQVKRFLEVAPEFEKAMVEFGNPADQILARGERGGADAPARGADRRSAQDLETVADGSEVVQPLVRLFPRPRRHVQGHRYVVGALACGAVRRQETCAAQCHLASLVANSVQGDRRAKSTSCRSARSGMTILSPNTPTNSCRSWTGEGRGSLPPAVLRAHESVVDRGRLIKPMSRVAVRRLTAGRPAVRIYSELVMPHRDYVTSARFLA